MKGSQMQKFEPEKFMGFNVPGYHYGVLGEMMALCENVRSMDCCVDECQNCLFNYDDIKKHEIFRKWKARNNKERADIP